MKEHASKRVINRRVDQSLRSRERLPNAPTRRERIVVKRVARKAAPAVSGANLPLARVRIDPFNHAPIQYPDKYTGYSAVTKLKQVRMLEYTAAEYAPDDAVWPAGFYHYVVVPDMLAPFRYLAPLSIGATMFKASLSKNHKRGWIQKVRALSEFTPPEPPKSDDDSLTMMADTWYNVIWNFEPVAVANSTNDDEIAQTQWPRMGIFGGQDFFGISMHCLQGVTANSTMLHVSVYGAQNDSFSWRLVSEGAIINSASSAAFGTTGMQNLNLSGTGTGVLSEHVGPVGLQLKYNNISGNMPTAVVSLINMTYPQTANEKIVQWFAPAVDESEQLQTLYQQYRCVAQATLQKFTGSNINNAGRIAAYAYRGGYSPGLMHFEDFATVAKAQEAKTLEGKTGLYNWWQPFDTEAMEFRPLSAHVTDFPYLVVCGFTGDSTGVILNSFEITTVSHYEGLTKSQILTQRRAPVRLSEADATLLLLKDAPQIMENPLHLPTIFKTLSGVVRKTFDTAKAVHGFYKNNQSWIDPALSGIVTAASAL